MNISGSLTLKKNRDQSILRRHPWVFSGAIQQTNGKIGDGDWVEVLSSNGQCLGFGHFQKGSIAVRILSFENEHPAENFWVKKIAAAHDLRQTSQLPNTTTNAFRLVHGEGDGLPGLIVDFYNGVAVVQAHSSGMHNDRAPIASALKEVLKEDLSAIFYKSQSTLPGDLRDTSPAEYLLGAGSLPHTVLENGNKFYVNWEEGQKTGFFLDQRDNRKLLHRYSRGRRVLNTFCYTGGFSVYALQGGAEFVHSVDSSEKAIAMAIKNIELNGYNAQENACFAEDTFDFLKGREGNYDMIVLDPPAFAKHREAKHQAMKGYQRLNAEAIKSIKPGGIIFTFSCSQVVDRKLFYDTVVSSAVQAGRSVKVLHQMSQPADHPVSIFHPEGEYLKGLVLLVE